MTLLFRLLGILVLTAVVATFVFGADLLWNSSRLFYAAVGRDALVRACMPGTRDALVGRGFSPVDLVFDRYPSIGATAGSQGASRTFGSAFTFSDGPGGLRVDGRVICVTRGSTTEVEVDVDSLPRRVT